MGGVAGHAGVFSTADDLAKFCQMILDGGDGIFKASTIQIFTAPATAQGASAVSRTSTAIFVRIRLMPGELFPIGSFGHTAVSPARRSWIDPASQTYVILLANSVHPHV